MRVLLDATAVPTDRGGVGRYVDNLVRELDADLEVACQARDADLFRRAAPSAVIHAQHPVLERTIVRLAWEQIGLPRLARRRGVSVIHSPHYTIPLATRRRRVVTVHDGTFFSNPEVHSRVKACFFRTWTRISGRLAHVVVTPSRATRDEVERFTRPFRRSVVAYLGVDLEVFHPPTRSELDEIATDLGHPEGGWIAFLGTLEPRKNVPALIGAFDQVIDHLQSAGRPQPALVLAGGPGWDDGVGSSIDAMTSGGRVVRLGYVPVSHLRALLGGAELVVYPSLGEGFGLPVLEAMACSAPVLTTRRLSLPEVGGDAVAYTEPDATSLREAILELLEAPARRSALAARAEERASGFTWTANADAHRAAYVMATE